MPVRQHTINIASGISISSGIYIGPSYKCVLVVSNISAINAGAGNTEIRTQFGLSETDTNWVTYPNTVTTETSKGIYPISAVVTPYIRLQLATLPTGTGSNGVFNLVVYSYDL